MFVYFKNNADLALPSSFICVIAGNLVLVTMDILALILCVRILGAT